MSERALFGAMFTFGVVTALAAGLAGWQLGRSRTAPPPAISSTALPPSGPDAETVEPIRPSPDVPLSRPAAPQRAVDESAASAPPAIDLPAQSTRETAAADLAPSSPRPTGPERELRAVVPERRSDPVPPTPPADVAAKPRSAPSLSGAPAHPDPGGDVARAPVADAVLPGATVAPSAEADAASRAAEIRSLAVLSDRNAPAVGPSVAAGARALSVTEVARLAAPPPAAPDYRPVQVLAALAPSSVRADSAPAALPAPAPALQAPAEAPFVVSVTLGEEGPPIPGVLATPLSTARSLPDRVAAPVSGATHPAPALPSTARPVPDQVAAPSGEAARPAQTRSDPSRLFPPAVTLEAGLPAGPSPTAVPMTAPRLGATPAVPPEVAKPPVPVGTEVTAAIPGSVVVAPPSRPTAVPLTAPRLGATPAVPPVVAKPPVPVETEVTAAIPDSAVSAPPSRPTAVPRTAPRLGATPAVPSEVAKPPVPVETEVTAAIPGSAVSAPPSRPTAVPRTAPRLGATPAVPSEAAKPPVPVETEITAAIPGSAVAAPPSRPTAVPLAAPRLGATPAVPSDVAKPRVKAKSGVTAAIPDSPVVAPASPPPSVKPRKAERPVEKRRRVAAIEPDRTAAGPRMRGPRPHVARNRLMTDGALRLRSPVTVIYGTVPRREVGPVLIRIHAAGNGRIRTSRIPLY